MRLMNEFVEWMQQRGLLEERRKKQNLSWLHETVRAGVIDRFYHNPSIMEEVKKMEDAVSQVSFSPFQAATALLKKVN
jgi:putative protein kinase ArgK-like GTPase of G3E family